MYQSVGLVDHMAILFLVFQGTSILFSIVAASIYILINMHEGFLFFTSSPSFIVCRVFDGGHSDLCEVTSRCSCDLHFSDN